MGTLNDEQLNNALGTLKMLLGITDDNSDELLSFLISDTVNLIMGYCRIDTLPRQLESVVPALAADMYRAKGYGKTEAPSVVKSISQGERSVSYADNNLSDESILTNYYNRLNPFRNRKGRVPSEVK